MMNRFRGPLRLAFLLALASATFSRLPAVAQTPTLLHEAVAQELVLGQIGASDVTFGELSLTLSPGGDPLMITIPAGTRFAPDDTGLSEVISLERIEILVQDETRIDPLPVASLASDKPGPSPLNSVAYRVDGMVSGPLLQLLERLQTRETPDDSAAQLAIWAVYQGRSVTEVMADLKTPPPAADAAAAAELIAGLPSGSPEASEDSGAPDAPDAPDDQPPPDAADDGGISLGTIVIGVLVLAGIVVALAAAATMANRKRTHDDDEVAVASPVPPSSARPAPAPRPAPRPAPPAPRPPRTDTISIDIAAPLILHADDGRQLSISEDTVISRLPVAVQVLRLAGLSSPHVYLYWTDSDVQIRDLNSEAGATLDGRPLGQKRVGAPFGSTLLLAGVVALTLQRDGIQVEGRTYPATAGDMIISREPLAVLALGDADRKISTPHCLIRRLGDDFAVRDLNSSNGVVVDGAKTGTDEKVLGPDGKLQLGQTTFSRSGG